MVFGKKRNWEDQYDEDYVARADRQDQIKGSTFWIHLIGFGLSIAAMVGLVGLILGQHMLEKTLTALANPVGMVWLILLFQAYFSLFSNQIWSAFGVVFCWAILTVFGNSFIANQLIFQLEEPHLATRVDELPKLDVLFLLGGGTTTNLSGSAQLGVSGDRLVTAARIFQSDRADLIVCSGLQLFRTSKEDREPHQEAFEILSGLGIPQDSIAMIKGYNTKEEMALISEFLQQQNMADAKIGIVTSAWHLSRARRLAESNGLRPVLIPSDFRSSYFSTGPGLLIPGSAALGTSARCIKEFLASLIGR